MHQPRRCKVGAKRRGWCKHGSSTGFLTVIKKMPRPTFEPTPEQRVQVQTLAEYGAPEAHIATKLGIAKNTLSKYFAAELEAGQQEAKLQVGTFILDSILGRGGIRDDRARATLAIFYAKTRMGWKETGIHLHGEAHPDTDTALEALTRRFDRLAARKGEETAAPACTGGSEGSSEVGLAVLGETGATIAG